MAQTIRITDLYKQFGAQRVLEGIDLDIQAGEFVSLLGPSGCGKSTLLRIIAGLEGQDAGSVRIGDSVVDGLRPRERNVAMVFQNYALYPHMSVRENIAMPLLMSRLGLLQRQPYFGRLFSGRQAIVSGIHSEVHELGRSLGLEQLFDRKPGQLSGGQRQRVALARAMVRQPAAFLMDEPLSNLDAKLRVLVRDELADLHRRLGATFLYVTHDQTEAMTLSSRVAVMDQGRILQFGTPQDLYERPANLAVARFVGTPSINVLTLTTLDGACRLGGSAVLATGVASEALRRSGGHAAARPEHLALTMDNGAFAMPVDDSTPASVRSAEHHGADWIYRVHVPLWASVVTVRVPQRQWQVALHPGAAVSLGWRWEDLLVFDAMENRCEVVLGPVPEFESVSA